MSIIRHALGTLPRGSVGDAHKIVLHTLERVVFFAIFRQE